VADLSPNGEQLTVEPMGNHPVVKDLVVSLDTFFNQIRRVDPYLQPDAEPEEGEFIASNESMTNLLTAMNCIMCGCCVSDCTVLEVDKNFIAPAALAKAWRFTEDPRDGKRTERLTKLNNEDGGIWDCTRCFQCVEVCPKDVAPMERIMEMREAAIEAGNKNTPGYRHTESFNRSVKKNGRLDESRLAVDSAGWTNIPRLLDLAPIGFRSMLKGKLPPIIPHKAEDKGRITDLFEKVERERQ
jgi:succinate dehydrogenase / fumarate reductase iron-sulfur subunit